MPPAGRSTRELTATLQRVKVPSYIINRRGEISWVNDAARSAFGDVLGEHYAVIVAPEDVEKADEQFRRKLEGVPVTDYEIDVLTAQGRRIPAEISSVPLRSGDSCDAVFGIAQIARAHEGPSPQAPRLTPRQAEVLRLLAGGSSTDQIAAALHLSRETVRNYVRQLLRALGAHSRLEAVANARREGILRDT